MRGSEHYSNAAGRNEFIALEKHQRKLANTPVQDTIINLTSRHNAISKVRAVFLGEGDGLGSPLFLSLSISAPLRGTHYVSQVPPYGAG